MKIKNLFLIIPIMFILSHCNIAQRVAILNCHYSLLNVVPVHMGLTSMELEVNIQIDNPNPVDVVLDRFGFDLFVNGSRVGSGDLMDRMVIPAGGTVVVKPVVKISYIRSGISIIKAIKRHEAFYELRGRATYLVGRRSLTFPVKVASGRLM